MREKIEVLDEIKKGTTCRYDLLDCNAEADTLVARPEGDEVLAMCKQHAEDVCSGGEYVICCPNCCCYMPVGT